MVKVNDRFEFERDTWGWVLHDWKEGINRKGDPTRTARQSYHANLEQVSWAILDRTGGDCKEIKEIIPAIERAKQEIREAVGGIE